MSSTNQPLLSVFENDGGEITIVYGELEDGCLDSADVNYISIKKEDAEAVATAILEAADDTEHD